MYVRFKGKFREDNFQTAMSRLREAGVGMQDKRKGKGMKYTSTCK